MQDELMRYKIDSTVHVTCDEKIIWNAKAPNESPNLTGVHTAPTPSATNISSQIATASFVNNAMRTIKPSVSESTDKLKAPINVQLIGKAKSTLVTAIEADAIRGTIAPANLTRDSTHRWIIDGEKSNYSDKYTRAQTDSKFLTKTEFVSKAAATIGIGWTIDVDETHNMVFKYNVVIKDTLQTDGTFIVPTLSEITDDTEETESITLSELRNIVDLRTTTLTSIENPPAFVGQHALVGKKSTLVFHS